MQCAFYKAASTYSRKKEPYQLIRIIIIMVILTHFSSVFHFYTPWKRQTFSEGIERKNWAKWVYKKSWIKVKRGFTLGDRSLLVTFDVTLHVLTLLKDEKDTQGTTKPLCRVLMKTRDLFFHGLKLQTQIQTQVYSLMM